MSTQPMPSTAGLCALARRADSLSNMQGLAPHVREFWKGYAKALADLRAGVGEKLAAKDSAAQYGARVPQGTDAALAVDGHRFAAADMPELVASKNVQIANDLVVDFKVNAVHQFEHDELVAFVPNDKQAVPAVDSHNVSTRHEPSGVIAESMAQRHSTAAKPESVKGTGGAA